MRLARSSVPVLLLCLSLPLAGCGARPAGTPAAPTDPLRGHVFLAGETTGEITVDGQPRRLVAGTRVSLEFTDDGRLLATAGCNTMSGPVRTAGGTLDATGLATTELGCDPPRHAQDEWLAGVLTAGPTWRLDGPTLTVRARGTTLVLTDRETAEPDRPLTGTTWAVDTVVDGQAAASTPAGATATLVFNDGQVRIFGGCNTGAATYTATGDTIRFGSAAMTRKACAPGIMRFEAAVLGVVGDDVTFHLDADRLTLNHPSGKGLQLHAR